MLTFHINSINSAYFRMDLLNTSDALQSFGLFPLPDLDSDSDSDSDSKAYGYIVHVGNG